MQIVQQKKLPIHNREYHDRIVGGEPMRGACHLHVTGDSVGYGIDRRN